MTCGKRLTTKLRVLNGVTYPVGQVVSCFLWFTGYNGLSSWRRSQRIALFTKWWMHSGSLARCVMSRLPGQRRPHLDHVSQSYAPGPARACPATSLRRSPIGAAQPRCSNWALQAPSAQVGTWPVPHLLDLPIADVSPPRDRSAAATGRVITQCSRQVLSSLPSCCIIIHPNTTSSSNNNSDGSTSLQADRKFWPVTRPHPTQIADPRAARVTVTGKRNARFQICDKASAERIKRVDRKWEPDIFSTPSFISVIWSQFPLYFLVLHFRLLCVRFVGATHILVSEIHTDATDLTDNV